MRFLDLFSRKGPREAEGGTTSPNVEPEREDEPRADLVEFYASEGKPPLVGPPSIGGRLCGGGGVWTGVYINDVHVAYMRPQEAREYYWWKHSQWEASRPADESHIGLQPKAVAETEGEDPEQGGSE